MVDRRPSTAATRPSSHSAGGDGGSGSLSLGFMRREGAPGLPEVSRPSNPSAAPPRPPQGQGQQGGFRIPTQRELVDRARGSGVGSGTARAGSAVPDARTPRGQAAGGERPSASLCAPHPVFAFAAPDLLRGTFPLPTPPFNPRNSHAPALSSRSQYATKAALPVLNDSVLAPNPVQPQPVDPRTSYYRTLHSLLSLRELGAHPISAPSVTNSSIALSVRARTVTQRWRALAPWPTRFAKVHGRAVHALDVDKAEFRYLLSSGADASIALWDLDQDTVPGAQNPTTSVHPQHAASAASAPQRLHPLSTIPRRSTPTRPGHTAAVTAVMWWPVDAGLFFTAGMDCRVVAWDANVLGEAGTWDLGERVFMADVGRASGGSPLVAVALPTPSIRLLDPRTSSPAHTLLGHTQPVHTVSWSPRSHFTLASGGADGTVRLWDVRKARSCVAVLRRQGWHGAAGNGCSHEGTVNGMCWTPEGHRLVTVGTDQRARSWDVFHTESKAVVADRGAPPSKRAKTRDGAIGRTGDSEVGAAGVTATTGPVDTGLNFGPHLHNAHPFPVRPCCSPHPVSPTLTYLPTDEGEVLTYDVRRARLVGRLRASYGGRVNVVCAREAGWKEGVITGAQDGGIVAWGAENSREVEEREALERDAWSDYGESEDGEE